MQCDLMRDGYAVLPRSLSSGFLAAISAATDALIASGRGGVRGVLNLPEVQELAVGSVLQDVAEAVLGRGCFPVRGILFDKTPDANWRVSWHQDVTIAVKQQREVAGFGPWSTKNGVPHVQAPNWVLEQMIAVRLHLDPC